MTLLLPIGLLGLMSVAALIIIYVIKPNYQRREVTSTYVWKLSLKYRKKRLPVSKLRNILLIACQVLALIAGALIMSQPIVREEGQSFSMETIAILDCSASMRAKNASGVTRFERAVNEVIDLANITVDAGGYVSVILSDGNDRYLFQSAGLANKTELNSQLDALIANQNELACSYGNTNLDNAITLCEETVKSNPNASVHVYTDKEFAYIPEGLHVMNVADSNEWNVGILNAYSQFEEGYCTFFVEVGCYGLFSQTIDLDVAINGASNGDKNLDMVRYEAEVTLVDNAVTTVIFRNSDIKEAAYEKEVDNIKIIPVGPNVIGGTNKDRVVSYDDVRISLSEGDSFAEDDSFSIYGGRKPELKIQYATYKKKTSFTTLLGVFRNNYGPYWDIVIDEVDMNRFVPVNEGYDLYIYDGACPSNLPVDGVVVAFNPQSLPTGFTARDIQSYTGEMYFVQEGDHAILRGTDASKIFITRCIRLANYDDTVYKTLWSVDGNPILLVNDGEREKVIMALFDTEYSNIILRNDFAYLFYNIIETFIPSTVRGNAFEVGEQISVNARSTSVTVSSNSGMDEKVVTQLPSAITLDRPDVYRFTQQTFFGKTLNEFIFVKVPTVESNIFATGVTLKAIYLDTSEEANPYNDLLVYFAAAMLALLFTEWFLQTNDAS